MIRSESKQAVPDILLVDDSASVREVRRVAREGEGHGTMLDESKLGESVLLGEDPRG